MSVCKEKSINLYIIIAWIINIITLDNLSKDSFSTKEINSYICLLIKKLLTLSGERAKLQTASSWASTVSSNMPELMSNNCNFPVWKKEGN